MPEVEKIEIKKQLAEIFDNHSKNIEKVEEVLAIIKCDKLSCEGCEHHVLCWNDDWRKIGAVCIEKYLNGLKSS